MRVHILPSVISQLTAAIILPSAADAATRLLNFPDVCADRIVFTHAGDLWTVGTAAGLPNPGQAVRHVLRATDEVRT